MAERNKTPYSLEYDELPLEVAARAFPHGAYAFSKRLKRKRFNERLEALQIELVKLQKWVRANNKRIVMLFEGRDAAGKGSTIRRFTRHLNPRAARVVALAKPSDVERGQWYFQRYVRHMPTDGEMVFFDRSWYNRSGVERVMGFCSEKQVEVFFQEAPVFEGMLVREGIHLFKFWLTVSRAEQLKRFYERKNSPLKNWKLSPLDHKAVGKWEEYSRAISDQLQITDSAMAPWTVIDSNDQRRARLAAIQVVLNSFDYDGRDDGNIGEIDDRVVMTAQEFLELDRSGLNQSVP